MESLNARMNFPICWGGKGTIMKTALVAEIKVADEVWIATALLHREHPDLADFTIEEIMERAGQENCREAKAGGLCACSSALCRQPPSELRTLSHVV